MTYNENLADRIRETLEHLPKLEEKKMFRGLTFMVDDKMCIGVRKDGIMCHIDPALHETLVEKNGCETMHMKNREYIGYVMVNEVLI